MAYLFLGIYYNVSIWYKLSDKTIYGALIASIGAIVTIVLSIILLPRIGVVASAYAALICYVLMVVLAYLFGQKIYAIDYPVGSMLRVIGLIVLVMFCGHLLRTDTLLINTLIGLGLMVSYLGALYILEKKKISQYF